MNETCEKLASPNIVNFIFSILILFGILFSYLPQLIRIISRRSSFGISPYFVLLGVTSGVSSFANILVLPKSARDIACCHEISGVACFAGLLGIFQVGVQTSCFAAVLVLFVAYFPRDSPGIPLALPETSSRKKSHSFRTAIAVAVICVVYTIFVATLASVVILEYPSSRQLWANILGIMSTILSSIQYFPQIYTTFRLRSVGSLSIVTMLIQTPGSLIWAASLAGRLGIEGWSTWGVFVVTAMLQGTLLIMCIYFEHINPQKSPKLRPVKPIDHSRSNTYGTMDSDRTLQDDDDSEDRPLLQDS
ncbi:hypothetical protein FQN57_007289 [Myotisia sp. PD_48]|nr:hypothetical protein FQN57_007289 [Myotisia sp. PD_48]